MWKTWFGSDPNVIGGATSLRAGTAPSSPSCRRIRFPDERRDVIPLPLSAAKITPGGFGPSAGRTAEAGMDEKALMAHFEPLARRVRSGSADRPLTSTSCSRYRPIVKPLRDQLTGGISTPLWILLGAVAIVFLIACANVDQLVYCAREDAARSRRSSRPRRPSRRPGSLTGDRGVLLAFFGGAIAL